MICVKKLKTLSGTFCKSNISAFRKLLLLYNLNTQLNEVPPCLAKTNTRY